MGKISTKSKCTICGKTYHNKSFLGGHVCEDCIGYIKSLDI